MKVCLKCSSKIFSGEWKCQFCGWEPRTINSFPILAPNINNGTVDYPYHVHNQLVQIEEKNFWFLNRIELINSLFVNFFPEAETVFETGCGTGFVLANLARLHPNKFFFGGEGYVSGLNHARRRVPNAKFIQFDACNNTPFEDEFDVIGAFDVIEHLADDERALKQMHKALKRNGGIIITVPQHQWLWSNIDEKAGHKRRYDRKGLIQKITKAGFKINLITSFVTLLLPLMVVSRLIKSPKSQPQVELRLPRGINAAFVKICALERHIIKNGFSLPLGGSLACVAKKD